MNIKHWIRKHWKLLGGTSCALLLAGCATVTPSTNSTSTTATPSETAIVSWHNACVAYEAGFAGALVAGEDGYLTKPDIQQVNIMDETITPLCDAKTPPSDLTSATQQITQAVTKLAIYEELALSAAKKAQGAMK